MRAREAETLPEYMKLLDSDGVSFRRSSRNWSSEKAGSFGMHMPLSFSAGTLHRRWSTVNKPYRVLSFPCAGGEEPYSIVMSLREAGLDFHQFQVDAADISETALQTARGGKYGLRSVRVVAPAIQERYFRVSDQFVEVLPEIRQAVRFIRANIIDAQSVFPGDTFDAVFCRNLLIYLTPAARQRVAASGRSMALPERLVLRRTRGNAQRV